MKIVLLLLFAIELSLAQTGTIVGRVSAKDTGEPLVQVNVLLEGSTRGTVTNIGGEFLFSNLTSSTYSLTFTLVGYRRVVLPEIVVVEGETSRVAIELIAVPVQAQPVIVTASKREQASQDVPVSVSTMDAASIARRNIVTLDDALRYIPGVNLTDWQVNIRGSSGYSRGAGSRVLLLVDGIPFTTGDTGELNFETFPANQVERIEVVKGAGSALYGSSALGGVINLISKRIPDQTETHIRAYGGFYGKPSFDKWDWGGGTRFLDGQSFSHSQRFQDVGILLFGSRAADDGYRQNDSRRRYNGMVKMNAHLSENDELTVTFNIMHQKRASFLYWKDVEFALVPPAGQMGNYVEANRFFLSGLYTHTSSKSFLYSVKGMWFHNKFEDVIDTATHVSRSDVVRGEVQATWRPDETNIVTFGVEGNTDNVAANLFGSRSGFGTAIYAQDEISITSGLVFTLGGRFDFQDVDSLNSVSQFNPKAGLVYKPAEGTALRASFGRGFRSPSVAEAFISTSISGLQIIPNPGLKPERSFTYEVGMNQVLGSTAMVDVALFHSDFDNLIEAGFIPQSIGLGQFSNVSKARIEGIEASTKLFFNEAWLFDAGYTYVFPKDLTKNDILKYRPRHLLYVSNVVRYGVFNLGVDFRYISRVERIDDEFVQPIIPGLPAIIPNGDRRGSAYVTDVRIGVDFSGLNFPLTAQLNIDNIFQYNYVELIGNIAPPRSIILTLEAQF